MSPNLYGLRKWSARERKSGSPETYRIGEPDGLKVRPPWRRGDELRKLGVQQRSSVVFAFGVVVPIRWLFGEEAFGLAILQHPASRKPEARRSGADDLSTSRGAPHMIVGQGQGWCRVSCSVVKPNNLILSYLMNYKLCLCSEIEV